MERNKTYQIYINEASSLEDEKDSLRQDPHRIPYFSSIDNSKKTTLFYYMQHGASLEHSFWSNSCWRLFDYRLSDSECSSEIQIEILLNFPFLCGKLDESLPGSWKVSDEYNSKASKNLFYKN